MIRVLFLSLGAIHVGCRNVGKDLNRCREEIKIFGGPHPRGTHLQYSSLPLQASPAGTLRKGMQGPRAWGSPPSGRLLAPGSGARGCSDTCPGWWPAQCRAREQVSTPCTWPWPPVLCSSWCLLPAVWPLCQTEALSPPLAPRPLRAGVPSTGCHGDEK